MDDASVTSSGFPPAREDDWRALVAKTLGDKPFESMGSATAEGLPIAPLYAPCPQPPCFPARRSSATISRMKSVETAGAAAPASESIR